MQRERVEELVGELAPSLAFAPASTVRGCTAPGTHVYKELVDAYAMRPPRAMPGPKSPDCGPSKKASVF